MHLVTTALEDTWPKGEPLLLLGPWCRIFGRPLPCADDAATMVADPWSTLESRQRAFHQSQDLFERLAPIIGDSLNALHGASYSKRFWRILIGPWLIRYLQIMKDRHERLCRALESAPGLTATTLDRRDRVTTTDTLAFTVLAYEDAYNFQLISSLLDKMGVQSRAVRRDLSPTAESSSKLGAARPLLKDRFKSAADRAMSAFDIPATFHDLGLGVLDAARICRLSGWRARPLRTRPFVLPSTQPQRARPQGFTTGFQPNDAFEKIIADCLPEDLPTAFVESFPRLIEAAHASLPPSTRVLVSANGWTYDEVFKAAAALASEKGARLVGIQHGGGYGLYARLWQEDMERSCTDSYWCWGWSGLDGDKRLRDVPAPSLSIRADERRPGSGLLFVANAQPRYPYGFQSQALGERVLDGIDDAAAFFEGLPEDIRRQSHVRVTKQDDTWGWRTGARLSRRCPELRVEAADEPLHERLRRCALTVIDHPSTSLLEAIALDRPLLMFWRPDIWDCRASARPLLDGLRRAGVLFDDPQAAARAAAQAWSQPRAWWSRREARAAVLAFRSQQAFSASDWHRRWAAALKAEVSAAEAAP